MRLEEGALPAFSDPPPSAGQSGGPARAPLLPWTAHAPRRRALTGTNALMELPYISATPLSVGKAPAWSSLPPSGAGGRGEVGVKTALGQKTPLLACNAQEVERAAAGSPPERPSVPFTSA
ncbi:hypothetical protein SKAU_G00104780 [Synaphobranchus kaupii]|uniref:Uncharacterized protein n=1 Tax=Synaphobranchus kaupii TaxID=118154 RepID=A0A9Q1G048_SYNKA|nr:hypothetical protein SKAU_G00104780 [Synaphobranchus kaupii]